MHFIVHLNAYTIFLVEPIFMDFEIHIEKCIFDLAFSFQFLHNKS